ncbi:50S ribosomal protein L32 [Candidatus Peregrinibacteria bacterium]|jgi:large subunit ribosomal protein L32|nr:50S ribosomal protein L32 [Candidatus Peregrinibacteria bacterium]
MAKHPVPKRKKSRTQTKSRYAAFKKKATNRLENAVSLAVCATCGAKRLAHHLCEECGTYKGRQVLKTKSADDKVTTIKA